MKRLLFVMFAFAVMLMAQTATTQQQLTINTCSSLNAWRLVYDGPIATQLFLSEGKTMTVHGLYCSTQVDDSTIPAAGTKTSAAAKQEMLDWAKGQKITIPDSVLNPKPVVKK